MSTINVKMRAAERALYDTKVVVELADTVAVLKQKICEKDDGLDESAFEVLYCGNVLEHDSKISACDLFDGATVHAYKRPVFEKPEIVNPLLTNHVSQLFGAMHTISLNASFRGSLSKLDKQEVINKIIVTTPGLPEDMVAITLLQRGELLTKFSSFDDLNRISRSRPALVSAVLKMAKVIEDEQSKSRSQSGSQARHSIHIGSDDDVEDSDDAPPAPDAPPLTGLFHTHRSRITSDQVASALASITPGRPAPPIPSNDPMDGESSNTLLTFQTMQTVHETSQLRIMREMGLTDEAANLEAIRATSDLEGAIELILSGVPIVNNSRSQ